MTISLEHHLQIILKHDDRTQVDEKIIGLPMLQTLVVKLIRKCKIAKNVAPSDWPIVIVFPLASYFWAFFFRSSESSLLFQYQSHLGAGFYPTKNGKEASQALLAF